VHGYGENHGGILDNSSITGHRCSGDGDGDGDGDGENRSGNLNNPNL